MKIELVGGPRDGDKIEVSDPPPPTFVTPDWDELRIGIFQEPDSHTPVPTLRYELMRDRWGKRIYRYRFTGH